MHVILGRAASCSNFCEGETVDVNMGDRPDGGERPLVATLGSFLE